MTAAGLLLCRVLVGLGLDGLTPTVCFGGEVLISTKVNNVKNEGVDLVERVASTTSARSNLISTIQSPRNRRKVPHSAALLAHSAAVPMKIIIVRPDPPRTQAACATLYSPHRWTT
jgi:hypothetical protein